MRKQRLATAAFAGVTVLQAGIAVAQVASQPIRIVFPFAPGGVGDTIARLMGEHLREGTGKPVIVENRTGAAGRLGVQTVKSAAPDGMTLLLTPIAPISIYPIFYKNLGYDPFKDLEPITQVVSFEFGLASAKKIPAASLKELVDWLKINKNEQSYGTPGAGTLPYFFALQFNKAAGLDLRHVSYKGSAAAVQDLVSGHLPLVFTTASDFTSHHKAGSVRVLATSQKQTFMPGVPTFKDAGFNIQGNGWYAMYAPAKTDAALLDNYAKLLADGARSSSTSAKLLAAGLTPTGTTRTELARIQKADFDLWSPIIKESGFTPDQ
jgi:tripartite-type tricarboxylate transporter receptor subunit TctC